MGVQTRTKKFAHSRRKHNVPARVRDVDPARIGSVSAQSFRTFVCEIPQTWIQNVTVPNSSVRIMRLHVLHRLHRKRGRPMRHVTVQRDAYFPRDAAIVFRRGPWQRIDTDFLGKKCFGCVRLRSNNTAHDFGVADGNSPGYDGTLLLKTATENSPLHVSLPSEESASTTAQYSRATLRTFAYFIKILARSYDTRPSWRSRSRETRKVRHKRLSPHRAPSKRASRQDDRHWGRYRSLYAGKRALA